MAVRKHWADDETPDVPDNVIEAPITPRRTSVSDILRARRIECGLEVSHVAQVLRIRPAVLIAIENGQFDQLPGAAYAVGFVRSYGTYLGLDAEALVLRFKNETAEASQRPVLEFPLPIRDSRVPTGPLLIICVLLAVITYGGWYYFIAKPSHLAEIVPGVPEQLHRLLDAPVVKPAPPAPVQTVTGATPVPAGAPAAAASGATASAVESASAPATVAPATAAQPQPQQQAAAAIIATPTPITATSTAAPAAPVPQTAVDGVPPVDRLPSATATAAPPAAPDLAQPAMTGDSAAKLADGTYGAPDGQARVVLHATSDSWIQVRDKTSNLLFTRVLKPGEHYNVPNEQGLTMIAGNAGGLDITVDGMNVPKIGEAGRVARNVSLDPDRLLAVPPHVN
ncbi:MAG TPA: helix-turn-helix domain-containing protein [Alphaproteobacteria bacterium]|nr:helix-turn-helix domain-containing protein [Alphaproteobacteria bacterium]